MYTPTSSFVCSSCNSFANHVVLSGELPFQFNITAFVEPDVQAKHYHTGSYIAVSKKTEHTHQQSLYQSPSTSLIAHIKGTSEPPDEP